MTKDATMNEIRLLRSRLFNTLCVYETDIPHKVWRKLDDIDDGLVNLIDALEDERSIIDDHKQDRNRKP